MVLVFAHLRILRRVVVRYVTAPLHLQRVCSGGSSSGCRARLLGNGRSRPNSSGFSVTSSTIGTSLRWPRPTRSRDQLSYITPIRQFYGMLNSQSAEAILVELNRLRPYHLLAMSDRADSMRIRVRVGKSSVIVKWAPRPAWFDARSPRSVPPRRG